MMFKAELGLGMEHIGYRGAAPIFQDMMAGQLDFAVVTLTEVLPIAKDGTLRMSALTSTQKAPEVPLVQDHVDPVLNELFGDLVPLEQYRIALREKAVR